MKIFCCTCKKQVEVRQTTGIEIYPKIPNLAKKLFYICDTCKNYVGTHNNPNGDNHNQPLGSIPSPELRELRKQIHHLLDPIWITGAMTRKQIYSLLATKIGVDEFHTANINNIATAKLVINELKKIG